MPQKEIKISNIKLDYFGKNPAGATAVVFSPGIISNDSTIEQGYD